jgi:predicted nicotinamide N-methyase
MTPHMPWIESSLAPPADAPHAWFVQTHRFGAYTLLVARPREPDRLLDDPSVLAASRSNDYMPYWAYLWPGAALLAQFIAAQQRFEGVRAIEIGCGLGLAGLAGLAAGMHVTFSDYTPSALAIAQHNARINRFANFDTRLIDWQKPPQQPFNIILGADVLYEPRCLNEVIGVVTTMLAPGGEAWLSDPDRAVADEFPHRARERSFAIEVERVQAPFEAGKLVGGRIFRLRHR